MLRLNKTDFRMRWTRFPGPCLAAACALSACLFEVRDPDTQAPGYASLDLSAEWSRAVGRWRVGAYAQLHNALDRANPARYHDSIRFAGCGYGQPDTAGGCVQDVWGRGLPRLPLAGLRVSF